MLVAKIRVKQKDSIVQVLKVGTVLFDSRDSWVLIKDLDKEWHNTEMRWVHPDETFFHWIRSFA